MRYRPLGGSGIEASVVGLGAWAIGGWMWGGTDEQASINAIHAAIDAGINLIDTAPTYGFGVSEEIVGKAIADRRDSVVLATKCGLVWDGDRGDVLFNSTRQNLTQGPSEMAIRMILAPDSIRTELEASLRRLGVDCVDLYQTHWQDPATPLADAMACLLKLKDEGKIRAIGVSNASSEQMAEYGRLGPVDSDQECYSMLDRKIEADQLPYCLANDLAVLAYSPLSRGMLTGKIGPDRTFDDDDARNTNPRFSVANRKKVAAMLDEIRPIAETHGVSLAQLAIAWTIAQPGITHALCGARNPTQAAENAAAADVTLSDAELATIDAAIAAHAADIA